MSRKAKASRSRGGADEDPPGKADYRAAVFSDRGAEKERPAELFRMDLISAMKMSDSEYIDREDYFEITDQWKEEWQRPVQVPVNLDDIPTPIVEPVHLSLALHSQSFNLPRDKLLHFKADERFDTLVHQLTQHLVTEDTNVCKYDADEQDQAWLRLFNVKMVECGLQPVEIATFERFFEAWEIECFQSMSKRLGTGPTADEEDIVCDVCWSPEGEEDNEMVFCDRCDICVHQACYGVSKIPDSAWLCRPCSLGLQPTCCLCNKKGGALKPTKSGTRWAHVNCAIWVPEVGFGDPDKMEPIINISKIPESRWNLVCSLCKQSNGAAIQCSVGSCKTAFHVTCAFEANLEMQELLSDDGADVTLKAYCRKHSAHIRGNKGNQNQIVPEKGRSTQASREAARSALASGLNQKPSKAEEAEANFHQMTSGVSAIAERLKTSVAVAEWIFAYWKLKRRSMGNRPLLSAVRACVVDKERLPYVVDNPVLAALRRFIILRQDLERARNLCYLVIRREKQKRLLLRTEADIYDKLPDLDIATSWRRLFMDEEPPPEVAGGSPSANDLRLIFGLESVFSSSLANEDKISTDEDKKIILQSRKKFKESLKVPVSSAPKVNRVVCTEMSPSKLEAQTSAMNPKLNKIRLRLAKSPSARTATIVSTPPVRERASPAVRNPKLEKLKIRIPSRNNNNNNDTATSTSHAASTSVKSPCLFDRIKDDLGLKSPSPATSTRSSRATTGGRGGGKSVRAGDGKSAASAASGLASPVPRAAKSGGGNAVPRAAKARVNVPAPSAPAPHRRIKVPTFMEEEIGSDSSSESSSNSSSSSPSSSSTSSSSEIARMNPRQLRRRRQAAAKRSEEEDSSSSSGSSSDQNESETEQTSGSEEENSSSSSSEEEAPSISDDSDFVRLPPPRKRARRG